MMPKSLSEWLQAAEYLEKPLKQDWITVVVHNVPGLSILCVGSKLRKYFYLGFLAGYHARQLFPDLVERK
jgi:hypothetical protein